MFHRNILLGLFRSIDNSTYLQLSCIFHAITNLVIFSIHLSMKLINLILVLLLCPIQCSQIINNWNELATFFKYPKSIQTLIYTTNPIESLNANIKRKTNSKGSFPTIDSAFKMLYMSTQEVQSKWERTSMRNWSEIYPQLCIFFSEIMEKYTK